MGWFKRKPTPEKHVEAAIQVASNLYENTKPEAQNAPCRLEFSHADSRYRYLMFCLSAMEVACAREMTNPTATVNECLHFLISWTTTESTQEFFGDHPVDLQDAAQKGAAYLQGFLNKWWEYVELNKSGGRNAQTIELICSMIHSTESSKLMTQIDKQRLEPLALQIEDWLPTMRDAFMELVSR